MQLNTTQELIEEIRSGNMVILMDDEDRENEGDLVIAANCVTPEVINFMSLHARGLICLTLRQDKCQALGLDLMVQKNTAQLATNFTVSIDAARGISTGISAFDRAKTILDAVKVNAGPQDLVVPGHIFPLMAAEGGVLSRAGHTEAGCDLAYLSGQTAAAVIVEIMNADGSMARRDDLLRFAQQHDLKIGTIADLIEYRMHNERTVDEQDSFTYATEWGEFQVKKFYDSINKTAHLAFMMGQAQADKPCLVRVQYPHFLRELKGTAAEDHYWTAQRALKMISEAGEGVLVLLHPDQSMGTDFDEFSQHPKPRKTRQTYDNVGVGSQILTALNVGKMRLMGPEIRFPALSGFGLEITEFVHYE